MVSRVSFTPVTAATSAPGLLGFVRLRYGDLVLDRLELRRTGSGGLTLRFPSDKDPSGWPRPVVRPVDDEARRRIEDAVLSALGLR